MILIIMLLIAGEYKESKHPCSSINYIGIKEGSKALVSTVAFAQTSHTHGNKAWISLDKIEYTTEFNDLDTLQSFIDNQCYRRKK